MKHILVIIIALYTSVVNADVLPEQKLEVEHLLSFVKTSPCKINRNGDLYKGNEAISHIKRKYEYFKSDIKTAEQFIEYAATKSTLSGRYYMVKCGESKSFKTKEWLLEELQKYSKNKTQVRKY
jgi:hypothetical protein